jgi:hypothetical protein
MPSDKDKQKRLEAEVLKASFLSPIAGPADRYAALVLTAHAVSKTTAIKDGTYVVLQHQKVPGEPGLGIEVINRNGKVGPETLKQANAKASKIKAPSAIYTIRTQTDAFRGEISITELKNLAAEERKKSARQTLKGT